MLQKISVAFMAFVFSLLAAIAYSQSPREELKQLTAQLQSNPSDTALREKIIKLAQTIKPAPTVPEEARAHFVEGTAIAKSARSPAQQTLAVQSFQEALKIAPWWGDAYYNLAVAQELAGQFDAAQASFKLYILTNPGEKDARDARDRIYALNAKKKMAVADQNSPEAIVERERKFLQSLEGVIWIAAIANIPMDPSLNDGRTAMYQRRAYTIRNRQLVRSVAVWHSGQLDPGYEAGIVVDSIPLTGTRLTYRSKDIDDNCNPITLEISEDGSRITTTYSCYGRSEAYLFTRAPR